MASHGAEQEALDRALRTIQQELRPVAVLLFGSRATGRATARSDYDLGVFLGREAPEPFTLAALRTDVEDILGCDVDVVVLDEASPIVVMEALRSHRMLACHDRDRFADFVARTLIAYDDLKRVRAPIEAAVAAGRGS